MINELSQTGKRHAEMHAENQDIVRYGENGRFTVITMADGVSTCKKAKEGAEVASNAVTNLLLKKGEYFMKYDSKTNADFMLAHILYELKQKAEEEAEDLNEYSSTIASVLIDRENKKILCLNLGDGIILATENGRCRVLEAPSDSSAGCCVTTTENAVEEFSIRVIDYGQIESVIICSDGAWKQMYVNGRLKPIVAAALSGQGFNGLKEFLLNQEGFDDYSVVSVDIPRRRRKMA